MALARDKLNIACVAIADSGHMNPILLIAQGLVERGHRVRVMTLAFGADKHEERTKAFGAEFVGLPCTKTDRDIFSETEAKKEVPFFMMRDLMKPGLVQNFSKDRPQVVVADFYTLAAFEAAEEFGIQLVMNAPAGLDFVQGLFGFPDLRYFGAFAGVAVAFAPLKLASIAVWLNIARTKELCKSIIKGSSNALVLINTFFGLETSAPLPPSWKFTGPLAPLLSQECGLEQTHPELHRFLEGARDVVYISLGSMIIPERHIVEALFEAMKMVDCHVVWSLKESSQAYLPSGGVASCQGESCQEQLLSGSKSAFFIRSWLPQPALLCHPKVKAVVSHCGWGGILECIQAGKPILTLPFFGDQPMNANVVEQAGVALSLAPHPSFSTNNEGRGIYSPGSIRPRKVADTVQQMLGDSSYLDNAQRLRRLSTVPGLGRQSVCESIESAAKDGATHLHGPEKVLNSQPPALLSLLGVLVLGGAVALAAVLAIRG